MKRWPILSVTVLSALAMVGLILSVSARASPGGQSYLSATTALLPSLTDPPPTPPNPVFTATIIVEPDKTLVMLYDIFHVRVSVKVSEGCHYPFYDLRLVQIGEDAPVFEYISPITDTVGPGNETTPFTYTLRAIKPGTIYFGASAYGERYCGDYYNWTHVGGSSGPVTILPYSGRIFFPMVRMDNSGE